MVTRRDFLKMCIRDSLGTALSRIVNAPKPAVPEIELFGVDVPRIRRIIDSIPDRSSLLK